MTIINEELNRREIPCLIVYSDEKHVDYVNNIVNPIQEVLNENEFIVQLLSHETLSDNHLGTSFESLAEKCALAIVILDGLRPNIVFEYGFLRGNNKPIVLIQDKNANVAIKSFFYNWKDQDETGLTTRQMETLKDPKIGFFNSFSDRAGVKVLIVDRNAEMNSSLNPKIAILNEIDRLKSKITEECDKLILKESRNDKDYFSKNIVDKLMIYILKKEEIKEEDLEQIYQEVKKFENIYCRFLSPIIYKHLATLFMVLANKLRINESKDIMEIKKYYEKAIDIFKDLSKYEREPIELSKIYLSIGNSYFQISHFYEEIENCKNSIFHYKRALNPYVTDYFKDIFAEIKLKVGVAFTRLAHFENEGKNCLNAINSYNDALIYWTIEKNRNGYATLMFNLGVTHTILSRIENRINNCKKGIEAFNEVLKIWNLQETPKEYALLQQKLGESYHILSGFENKDENSRKSIESLIQALKVFNAKDYLKEFSNIQRLLAVIYFQRANFENKVENCKESIKANSRALKYFTLNKFPNDFANLQNNIGITYIVLSEIQDTVNNCEIGLKAFDEALKIYNSKSYPETFATIKFHMGNAYNMLSKIKKNFKEYCKNGIKSYKEAFNYFKDQLNSKYYYQINSRLNELIKYCKNSRN